MVAALSFRGGLIMMMVALPLRLSHWMPVPPRWSDGLFGGLWVWGGWLEGAVEFASMRMLWQGPFSGWSRDGDPLSLTLEDPKASVGLYTQSLWCLWTCSWLTGCRILAMTTCVLCHSTTAPPGAPVPSVRDYNPSRTVAMVHCGCPVHLACAMLRFVNPATGEFTGTTSCLCGESVSPTMFSILQAASGAAKSAAYDLGDGTVMLRKACPTGFIASLVGQDRVIMKVEHVTGCLPHPTTAEYSDRPCAFCRAEVPEHGSGKSISRLASVSRKGGWRLYRDLRCLSTCLFPPGTTKEYSSGCGCSMHLGCAMAWYCDTDRQTYRYGMCPNPPCRRTIDPVAQLMLCIDAGLPAAWRDKGILDLLHGGGAISTEMANGFVHTTFCEGKVKHQSVVCSVEPPTTTST